MGEAGSKNATLHDVQAAQLNPRSCRLEGSMRALAYDVFRKDLLGTPVWMETAPDLETAKLRVTELAGRSPGEYFVVSQETQEIVNDTAAGFGDLVIKLQPSLESET